MREKIERVTYSLSTVIFGLFAILFALVLVTSLAKNAIAMWSWVGWAWRTPGNYVGLVAGFAGYACRFPIPSADADPLAHGADGILLQPGHLGLGDPHQPRHLHLGLSVIKPHGKDLLFPFSQCPEGLLQSNVLHPAAFRIFCIPDLIHYH